MGILTSELTGVGEATSQELTKLSTIVILMLIPVGALLNAIVEEVIFRGTIQTELTKFFNISVAIFYKHFYLPDFILWESSLMG